MCPLPGLLIAGATVEITVKGELGSRSRSGWVAAAVGAWSVMRGGLSCLALMALGRCGMGWRSSAQMCVSTRTINGTGIKVIADDQRDAMDGLGRLTCGLAWQLAAVKRVFVGIHNHSLAVPGIGRSSIQLCG